MPRNIITKSRHPFQSQIQNPGDQEAQKPKKRPNPLQSLGFSPPLSWGANVRKKINERKIEEYKIEIEVSKSDLETVPGQIRLQTTSTKTGLLPKYHSFPTNEPQMRSAFTKTPKGEVPSE